MRIIILISFILISCSSSTKSLEEHQEREAFLKNKILKLELINQRITERYLNLAAYVDYFAEECLQEREEAGAPQN